jgi:riboflavin biosynthesis pyrimidine reductase
MQVLKGARIGDLDPGDPAALDAAYPWPHEGRWLRGMMLTTLDGAVVGADGRSKSISSGSDQVVFAATRRLCDVALIGAGTFRAERYRPMKAKPADAAARAEAGLAPAPVVAIVSDSLDLPWDEALFTESDVRPLVLTTDRADPASLATARRYADVVTSPGPVIAPASLLDELARRGLRRVVCEGGPRLLGTLAAAGLVDEIDLTVAPLMTSGGQVVTGSPLESPHHHSLTQVITADDGYLFLRYLKRDEAPS